MKKYKNIVLSFLLLLLLFIVYAAGRREIGVKGEKTEEISEKTKEETKEETVLGYTVAEMGILALQPTRIIINSAEAIRGVDETFRMVVGKRGQIFVGSDYVLTQLEDYLANEYPTGDVDIVLTDKMAWSDTGNLARLIRERDVNSTENYDKFKLDTFQGSIGEQGGISVSFLNCYTNGEKNWAYEPCQYGKVPECMKSFIVDEELQNLIQYNLTKKNEYLYHLVKYDMETLDFYVYELGDHIKTSDQQQPYPTSVYMYLEGTWKNGQRVKQALELPMSTLGTSYRFGVFQKDINGDGTDDLLFYIGNYSGTGGTSYAFCGFIWDDLSSRFVLFESLPRSINYWEENNMIRTYHRMGVFFETWYTYELVNGEYVESRTEIERFPEEDRWVERDYREDVLIEERYYDGMDDSPSHWKG